MIFCIGELLADMICEKRDNKIYYQRCAGGAPFNVACAVKKCGGEVSFYGNVGNDNIGKALYAYAKQKDFSDLTLCLDPNFNTTLAFVDLDENGERSFTFYRKNTADYHLDIKKAEGGILDAKIIHLGSLMLGTKEGRSFAKEIVKKVKENKKLLSFDVNFRADVFSDLATAVTEYLPYVESADILKMSEDEIKLFTPDGTMKERMKSLSRNGKLILLTLGKNGAAYFYNGKYEVVPTISVKSVDTTGAGDAFWGALLSRIDKNGFSDLDESVRFANICGALTTMGKGATDPIPTEAIINKYISINN